MPNQTDEENNPRCRCIRRRAVRRQKADLEAKVDEFHWHELMGEIRRRFGSEPPEPAHCEHCFEGCDRCQPNGRSPEPEPLMMSVKWKNGVLAYEFSRPPTPAEMQILSRSQSAE